MASQHQSAKRRVWEPWRFNLKQIGLKSIWLMTALIWLVWQVRVCLILGIVTSSHLIFTLDLPLVTASTLINSITLIIEPKSTINLRLTIAGAIIIGLTFAENSGFRAKTRKSVFKSIKVH
jgi:hypothetical protein